MDKHWLITYQQRVYGRELWQVANCTTNKSPAKWLIDTTARDDNCDTVLMFAVEITEDERQMMGLG